MDVNFIPNFFLCYLLGSDRDESLKRDLLLDVIELLRPDLIHFIVVICLNLSPCTCFELSNCVSKRWVLKKF